MEINKEEWIKKAKEKDLTIVDIPDEVYNNFDEEKKLKWDKYRKLQEQLINLKSKYWNVFEKYVTRIEDDNYKSIYDEKLLKFFYKVDSNKKYYLRPYPQWYFMQNRKKQAEINQEIDIIMKEVQDNAEEWGKE